MRRALSAYLLFDTTEWMASIAILVWAYQRGGAVAAGVAAVAQLVPAALAAPWTSVLTSRATHGSALAIGYGVQALAAALVALALASDAPFAVVVTAAAVFTIGTALTRPVHHAFVPDVAETPQELTAGNAMSGTMDSASILVGPALAGLLVGLGGAELTFAVITVMAFTAALLVVGVRPLRARPPASGSSLLRDAHDALAALRHDPDATVLLLVITGQYVVVGLMDVLVVVLALGVLEMPASGPGLLQAAQGVGALVAASASVVLLGRRRLAPALLLGMLGTGLAIGALGAVVAPWQAALLIAAYGASKLFVDVSARTLLQRAVPDRVLTRVFGVQESLMMLGLAIGSAVAPLLVTALDPRGAFLVAGAVLPSMALLLFWWVWRLESRAVHPGAAVRVLRRVTVFGVMDVPSLERVSAAARQVTLPVDTLVISQGDPGEHAYVLEQGTLRVDVDHDAVATLHPTVCFGEIALLRNVPRTASVTTTTPCTIWSIDRDAFLEAVGGVSDAEALFTRDLRRASE
jgi:MFS family permease